MAFCTHCVATCNTLWDDHGFISCSACGKVLGQVKIVKNINSHTRFKKVKRTKKINSQLRGAVTAVEEAAR